MHNRNKDIRISLYIFVSLGLCSWFVKPVTAQSIRDGDPVSIGTFRQLHSDVLDEDRLLLIYLPRDYEDSDLSYPILYVCYGDQVRGYFAEAVHIVDRLSEEGRIPRMIIVGVANVQRYRDLSPDERQGRPSGIEPFSRFVSEEMIPFVDGMYRTKDFRVLMGPQAGAEFGFNTLAKRPGLFDAFILENPFRYGSAHEILLPLMEEVMEAGLPSFTFLQITAADRVGQMQIGHTMDRVRILEKALDDQPIQNLKLVTYYVEGSEDFLPPLRLKEGLRALFQSYSIPEDQEIQGLQDVIAHYTSLSDQYGYEVDIPEMTLAYVSDDLMVKGNDEAALEVLGYLIGVYPASLDGYWRLANIHNRLGNKDSAIGYFRKCLEIMPGMQPAREMIQRLETQE